MFSHQRGRMGVIFQHTRKFQPRAPETEIHRRLAGAHHEFRKVIAARQRGEDPIALPRPGNDPAPRQVGIELPFVFQRIFFQAPVQPVVIPSRGD